MRHETYKVIPEYDGFYAMERVDSLFLRRFKGYRKLAGPYLTAKEAWEVINFYDAEGYVP